MGPRDVPATLAAVLATVATWVAVALRPTAPLYGLVVPAGLLPVAYVVDTATGPRVDDVRPREAAMLSVGFLAVLLGGLALSTRHPLVDVLAAATALGTLVVVASTWRRRAIVA